MSPIEFEHRQVEGLVSIVIPTRRGERFIGATLASIGSQTYRNWEVIVVEDGPGGYTQRIVDEFASRHPQNKVKFHRNDRNYGASFSRNVAFSKSEGEFIALLDSDDRWFPDHLARAVAELRDQKADIAYSSVVMIEDGTDILLGVWGPDQADLRDFAHRIFLRNFVTPSATVLRRDVIEDVGPWETNLRYCEDVGYWLRCIVAGKKFHYIGGCHCLYRKNHAGATTQKMCGTLEEFADIVAGYISIPGMRERTLRRFAAKAYVRAAKVHRKGNPQYDPSADASRAAMLVWKAWHLKPKRLDYFLTGALLSFRNLFRRSTQQPAAAPAPAVPTILSMSSDDSKLRKAA